MAAIPGMDMTTQAATYAFDDLAVGMEAGFDADITAADIDRFAAVSGDASPLHMDDAFARSRGFAGRVAHGALLAGLASRLVGMRLPGRDALLQSVSLQFKSPATAGTAVRVTGVVDQLSPAVRTAVLKVIITDRSDGRALATGKVHVGFTTAGGTKSHD